MPRGGFSELFKQAAGDRNALLDLLLEREIKRTGKSEEAIVEELAAQWQRMRGAALEALAKSLESSQLVQAAKETWQPQHSLSLTKNSVDLLMTIAVLYEKPDFPIISPPGAEAALAAALVTLTEGTRMTAEQILEAFFVAKCVSGMLGRHIVFSGSGRDCRHHCGLVAAPAAAALAILSGGTADMLENAITFAMLRCVDFACLPVGEMVQLPCAARNAAQVLGALISTDNALQGEVPPMGPDEAFLHLCATAQ